MKLFKTSFSDLSSAKGPSDLLSLQLSNKSLVSLPEMSNYKNLVIFKQIELDASNNQLVVPCPEILALKNLRKLNLSKNQIEALWPLPSSLEDLDLSYNKISTLNDTVFSLASLHTLDLSFNLFSGLKSLEGMRSLKYLYISNNEISTVAGIEKMNLVEVDLSDNKLESLEGLSGNLGLLVVKLKSNPVLGQFDFSENLLKGYLHAENGLFFKNFDLIAKIKSSRFKGVIKKFQAAQKYKNDLASPQWANLKTTEENEVVYYNFDPNPEESSVVENEEEISTKKAPVSKLNLEKIGIQISCEKSSTKQETSIESLFEDIISYFQIEEHREKEFSFSSEKYEQAVNFLKKKEDERKILLKKHRKKQEKLELVKNELEKQTLVNGELKKNIDCLKAEFSRQDILIKKITCKECVEASIQTAESIESFNDMSIYCCLDSYRQTTDLGITGEFSKHLGNSDYLVHNDVRNYIEKLLKKISGLVRKKREIKKENRRLYLMISKNKY